jgi:aminotransferase
MSLVDPGEEVLVPDPGFLGYIPSVEILTAYPVSVKLDFENGFEFTAENLNKAIKDLEKVKALIINTPSNPTGTVLSRKSLEEIADIAVEQEIFIISDEAYEHLVYQRKKHISIGSLNGMRDYVVTLHTFSKSYAMPGFRVGYAHGPKEIIEGMAKLHIYSSLCAPSISQYAALEALRNRKEARKSIKNMVKSYDERRKLIVKRIKEIEGFEIREPFGAFYAFPKFNFKMKAYDLSEYLIKKAKVATLPGTEFGRYGEGFLRFSYATAYEKIEEAMDRIENAVKGLR